MALEKLDIQYMSEPLRPGTVYQMNDIWVKDSSYVTQYEYVGDAMPFTLLSAELSMPRQGVT